MIDATDFNDISELFTRYIDAARAGRKLSEAHEKRIGEVYYRLFALNYLYQQIRSTELPLKEKYESEEVSGVESMQKQFEVYASLTDKEWLGLINEHNEQVKSFDVLTLYVESFYYCAWRLVSVIRHFPGMESIKGQVNDLLMTRNKLLEHAGEQDVKYLLDHNFAWSIEEGLQLRGTRIAGEDDQGYRDPGFNKICREFAQQLRSRFKTYLSSSYRNKI